MNAVTLDPAWAVPGYDPVGAGGPAIKFSAETIVVDDPEAVAVNKMKKLIRHDEKGFILQTILDAARPMDEISQAYAEAGIDHMLYDGPLNVLECYVDVTKSPKELVERPDVVISGELRPIKADGVDALHLTVQPEKFTLYVWYDNKLAHQEDVTDGNIEFSIDQAGTFRVTLVPEHPYKVGAFEVIAQ